MISYQKQNYPFSNILGWSSSRYEVFSICKRKYYFTYYSKFDKLNRQSQINKLKSLNSIPLAIGTIVHNLIKAILERLLLVESDIDEVRLKSYILDQTKQFYSNNTFIEHYYQTTDADFCEDLASEITSKVLAFLNSPSFFFIKDKALPQKNRWVIDPAGYGETRIDGMKAYCKVDFAFPIDDTVHIYDWKTGKKSIFKHKKQMVGYSYWASEHFNISRTHVIPKIVYLNDILEEEPLNINENEINNFPNKVKKESIEMYGYCIDKNENIPLEIEKFDKNENIQICLNCNFREICFES